MSFTDLTGAVPSELKTEQFILRPIVSDDAPQFELLEPGKAGKYVVFA